MSASQTEHGGPAFPQMSRSAAPSGMTLRDYFAAKAIQGMVSCQDFVNEMIRCEGVKTRAEARAALAAEAYRFADAMLAAREKQDEPH